MTTFYDFQRQFPDDEACLKRIMKVRYGGTEIECPKCNKHGKFYRMTKERGYVCQHCGHHLHPTVGTIFERSRTPLHKWFYAMFLFTTSRHGVSAKELQRQLGVTYKTAWRMAHEIRKYMAKVDGDGTLDGHVELDEAYIGGRAVGGKKTRADRTRYKEGHRLRHDRTGRRDYYPRCRDSRPPRLASPCSPPRRTGNAYQHR